jgi:hypothetical protein
MNLQIEISELKKRSLMVCTPMYGGQCHGLFTKSCCDLAKMFHEYGIELKFFFLFNESLITRARNYCADEFLRSKNTHLMFIDSDIGFDPNDVLSMMAIMDPNDHTENRKEIMCGAYPKKTIAWEKIKRAVDKGFADDNPGNLEKYIGDYVFNPTSDQTEVRIDEPCSVLEGGTGFMMIQRSAFEKFNKGYPSYSYRPDHARTKHFDGSRKIMMYFQALIDPKSERYLSEDYMFCQWMRELGVKTWLCPWMKLVHCGSYMFGGSLIDLAQLGAIATADANEISKMKT